MKSNLNPNDVFYHGWIPSRDNTIAYAWFTTKDEETRTFIEPMSKDDALELNKSFGSPVHPEEAGIFINTQPIGENK